MVDPRAPFSFWRDDRGVSLTEGLITIPIVLLIFAAFVEFGYAMSQWNQTVKALQYGARLAAVSDPLVDGGDFADAFPSDADDPLNNGDATPNDSTMSLTCGGDSGTACDPTALSRIVGGSDGVCEPGDPRPGICDLNWRITPDKLMVTYQRSGLGYWGRPDGPVLTMRLEVRDITFDLPILGGLLGLNDIAIPAHPVTITTEDLKTCSTC
jgi:hypothetical protein